jgi:hypothetical protein
MGPMWAFYVYCTYILKPVRRGLFKANAIDIFIHTHVHTNIQVLIHAFMRTCIDAYVHASRHYSEN